MAVSHTSSKAVSQEAADDLVVEMHAELVQIWSDVAALMKTVASLGKKVAADVQGQTLAATGELAESGSNAIKVARQQVSTLENEVAAQVKEKPLQALLLALGLGFLISLLIRR